MTLILSKAQIYRGRNLMECGFFTLTGWLFGLISVVIAIHQWMQKEKYRKKVTMHQDNSDGATGYQAENMTVKNKK